MDSRPFSCAAMSWIWQSPWSSAPPSALVAAAIYFFVVMPVNAIEERRRRGKAPADPTTKQCPECLSEVPVGAMRCAFCTQPLQPLAGARSAEAFAGVRAR